MVRWPYSSTNSDTGSFSLNIFMTSSWPNQISVTASWVCNAEACGGRRHYWVSHRIESVDGTHAAAFCRVTPRLPSRRWRRCCDTACPPPPPLLTPPCVCSATLSQAHPPPPPLPLPSPPQANTRTHQNALLLSGWAQYRKVLTGAHTECGSVCCWSCRSLAVDQSFCLTVGGEVRSWLLCSFMSGKPHIP